MIDKLSWMTVYPELVLLVMACAIAMIDLFVTNPRRTVTYVLTLLTLGVVAVMQGLYAVGDNTIYGFGNMVVSDPMGNWLKCFATLAMMRVDSTFSIGQSERSSFSTVPAFTPSNMASRTWSGS
jgi:NADH-quinone oxidoreductase subunit N